MIVLDTTLKSLEIILGGAITTNQLPWTAHYVDILSSIGTATESDGATNSATAVTMVAAPASSSHIIIVREFTVFNLDTVTDTATVRINDNGTFRNIFKIALASGDNLVYKDADVTIHDSNGNLKIVASLGVPSSAHAVLIGEGQFASIVGLVGTTNQTLQGVTGADPAWTSAPTFPSATVSGTLTQQGLIDASGASAGQIKFPSTQNASTNANTIDDYSVGTWTPVIGGATSTTGQTYTVQVGSYVKIGKLVWAQYKATLSAKGTITGSIQIQGLPYTTHNVTNESGVGAISFASLATNWISVVAITVVNTTAAAVQGTQAAAASTTALAAGDIGNTTSMAGFLVYRATS